MRWAILLSFGLVACSGEIGGTGDDPDAGPPRDGVGMDAMFGEDAGFTECGETGQVLIHLEERCAGSSCHGGGGRFPLLTRDGIAALSTLESQAMPGERLVIPGDPDGSWLYKKMAGLQGDEGGALMPLGTNRPSAEAELIRTWIADGAETSCEELPPTRLPYDPNSLDPTELFTCADPSAERSSPARLRRVERREFTHAVLRRLGSTAARSTVRENPLSVPSGLPYSTYTDGVSIDAATLDLLMLNLPEAARPWSTYDPGTLLRMEGFYGERDHRCIEDAEPDDECLSRFVEAMLTRGMLYRTPTDGERSRVRALLDERIATETDRGMTLSHVAQSALLMGGALFRSEVGDTEGQLTNDELALALGHVLSSHPVGAPFVNGTIYPSDPDAGDRPFGRMSGIREAANDGSIQDPEVRRALLRRYGFGISAERPDIGQDEHQDTHQYRGEYWLAPNIMAFFREWLGTEEIGFKDTPAETSAWEVSSGTDVPTRAYSAQSGSIWGRRFQPTLVEQLDDAVARIVIESDENGTDVFRDLMTSRRFSLPSTTGIGGSESVVNGMAMPYGIAEVLNDPAARWTTMPEGERMGVLTHPTWLAAHGGNFEDDASMVLRGKWIREALFCQTVPPLELVQVEAQLIPSAEELSARQRVTQSTEMGPDAETCMGCHRLMNPLGVAFELYNHAGFLRESDHGGAPDGSTTIDNLPDPALNRAYASPFEFIEAIANSSYARRSFIRHAFRFFMGRAEVMADACTLAEMEAALDESGSFMDMLEALIASDTFARRHVVEGGSR